MDEEEEKSLEEIKSYLPLTPELAIFRANYWKDRNKIFNELYEILYDKNQEKKEANIEKDNLNDYNDSFNDIKSFDKTILENFKNLYYKPKSDKDIKNENPSVDEINENSDDEMENDNEIDNDLKNDFYFINRFINNSKKMIYNNYLKNYVNVNKKLSNNLFSLSANLNKEIFFQIKNVNIFEINYLIKIKIKDYKEEWVCNAYYGCYLLYKILKCKKPFPIYPNNNNETADNIKIKTISAVSDFNLALSKGVNEFGDHEHTINLDSIIENNKYLFNIDFLKNSVYKKYLNLNEQIPKKGDYKFLEYLFNKKNFLEEFTYIFGSKNYLSTEKILENLIDIYKQNIGRFLYLDLEYINNLQYRKDLKEYLSFRLIRPFFNDYEKYKSFCSDKIRSIEHGNIGYLIKNLIEFIRENYIGEKLFIILNNVNNEKSHKIIEDIKRITEKEDYHHNFLIFCNIENEYNFKKFCEIYKNNQEIKLILIPNLIFDEPINDAKKEIKNLFFEYSVDKFVDLIKIFHFSYYLNYKSEISERETEIHLIKKYIKFFKLIIENNYNENKPIIKNIKFKNNEIEQEFLAQYANYFAYYIESEARLQNILNLPDGYFFEKLIILDILTGKIIKNEDYNFINLEVDSLFGLDIKDLDLEEYKDKNIIFTQKSKTAEIFDFAILVKQKEGLIMKLYQVTTKKSKDDLEKLDVDIIKLHCININHNLQQLGEITKFSFGIITSYNCYKKNNKDYLFLKNDCKTKNYELFIYNLIEKKFYVEQERAKVNNEVSLSFVNNIYLFNDKFKLNLPNYNSFFELKPKLISMKYLNKNYKDSIEKYLDEDSIKNEVKIIGKISYSNDLINSSIMDNDIGLLISGLRTEVYKAEKKDLKKGKKELVHYTKNIEVKMIKEKEGNKIYERDSETNKIKEVNSIKNTLSNIHILLFKFDEKKFLGKKRNSEQLFKGDILKKNNK